MLSAILPADAASYPTVRYVLEPAHALPTLDFSVSVKSRFLNARSHAYMMRWLRYRRVISTSYIIGAVGGFVAYVSDESLGRPLAVFFALLQLPNPIAGLLVLRFHMLRLIIRTHDFWFFFFACTTSFLTFTIQVQDVRACLASVVWLGITPNLMIDAAIRAVPRLAAFTFFAIATMIAFLTLSHFQLIEGLRDFDLVSYKSHRLPASTYVTNGIITTTAMLLRNVYRKRAALGKRVGPQLIECVSYRCLLRFRALNDSLKFSPSLQIESPTPQISVPNCMQPLRYAGHRKVGTISAADTILSVSTWLTGCSYANAFQPYWRALGCAALLSVVTTFALAIKPATDTAEPGREVAVAQYLSLTLTMIFTLATFAVLHRRLFLALLSSFEFLYISVQVTVVHISLADFYCWHQRCIVLPISWLWIHWVLTIDALTPTVRHAIGFHIRHAAIICTLSFMSSAIVIHLLIFDKSSTQIRDRVLWSGDLLGHHAEFRLLPTFYNCFATLLGWSLRLLYRLWTVDNDVLVVLDGPVVFDNYLAQARHRLNSRLWHDIPPNERNGAT
ncbi:hypothetical protein PINS_up002191 [Pythium insidiosum]|nr:hypothetical protein PINS_up002191 [Pythium insidiosum]